MVCEAHRLAGQTELEVSVLDLSITDTFDSKEAMKQLFLRLSFSQILIARLMDHEGLTSAQELTIIRPNDLSDSLESMNRLFGNSSRVNARIYFPLGKIMKLTALSTYFRRYFTVNRIPDIRLIRSEEVSTFVEYMEVWNKKSDKVQEILSKVEIKFDPSNFTRFRQKIETLTSSIRGCRGITLEYLIRVENEEYTHPTEDAVPDVFSIDFMAKNASLKGSDFTIDNQTLYTILRIYLTDTTGWNVISMVEKPSRH